MKPWINYHHLFYFKTIAEEGTVSRAAIKLRVGQPTLSAQLKQFEETIGVQLFERHHKKLVLTEQGRIALDYSKTIFKMGSEMFEVLHDRMKPLKPTVHVGALDSISKLVVVQVVKHAFKITQCQVTVSEGKLDELLRGLTSHQMDILISDYLPSGIDAKGLNPKRIAKNNVGFYGAPKFRILKTGFPASISGQPLILPTCDSKLRYDIDHWAQAHGIELNIIAETQDVSMKKLLAIEGLGLIPITAQGISGREAEKTLCEVGLIQGVHEEFFMITTQRKVKNDIASKLMNSFSLSA
jgi:LysR family transcriptional activator of nhaA